MAKPPRLRTLKSPLQTLPPLAQTMKGKAEPARLRRKVYESRRWREVVRPSKLSRDPVCQRCKLLGITAPAEEVDHRVPIAAGGDGFADGNLVSLCRPCHGVKTECDKRGEPGPEVAASSPRTYVFR